MKSTLQLPFQPGGDTGAVGHGQPPWLTQPFPREHRCAPELGNAFSSEKNSPAGGHVPAECSPDAPPLGRGRCRTRAAVLGGTGASPPGLQRAQGRHCWPHEHRWVPEHLPHQSTTALTSTLDTQPHLHSRRSVGKPDGWCLSMWLPRAPETSLGSMRLPPQQEQLLTLGKGHRCQKPFEDGNCSLEKNVCK